MNNYKKDFPIFKQKYNGKPLVYLDSAATSQKPQIVIDSVQEFYKEYNSNIHRGIYRIAEKATARVEEVRKKVATFINAPSPSEIVFTHGTTEGINILAASYSEQFSESRGVLLSEMEHHSNFVPWQHYAGKKNAPIGYFVTNKNGHLDGTIIDSRGNTSGNTNNYSVISIAHVSNVLGTITDLSKLLKKTQINSSGTVTVLDGAQSVPHMKVDVQALDCDFLVFSGHKMLAPAGVGILWGKQNMLNTIQPLMYGSQMIADVSLTGTTFQKAPYLFEPGTLPLEEIVGLGTAIDYLSEIGMNTIRTHEESLTTYALEKLVKIPGLTLYGPQEASSRGGVISFTIAGIHPHDIAQVLGEQNVCVRAGHHCAMPLHKRLGVPATVRVSFHMYNDEADIEALIRGLHEAIRIFSI